MTPLICPAIAEPMRQQERPPPVREAVLVMQKALLAAGDQFAAYAKHHWAKKPPDWEKAEVNYALSDELESVGLSGTSEIAYAILRLAHATDRVALQLKYLGNADAATPMGAIEAFGLVMKEGMEQIADAIHR